MRLFALSDLHLPFGREDKSMEVFGPTWKNYTDKIKTKWHETVSKEDLVLIPGDVSWATHLEDALRDILWIDALPGTKILIKGNHDYFWSSKKKMRSLFPPSIHIIDKDALTLGDYTIGGARLWDTPEYQFGPYITYQENPLEKTPIESREEQKHLDEIIFQRELERLRLSLSMLNPKAKKRIAMVHYPPISADLQPSRAAKILEEYKIDLCVFGHLHNVREKSLPFGTKNGVHYLFTSCDYLDFQPIEIID